MNSDPGALAPPPLPSLHSNDCAPDCGHAASPSASGVPRVDLELSVGDLVKLASPRGMDRRLFRIHKRTKKGFEVRPVALLGWKREKDE